MTYDARETSVESGAPLLLVQFSLGAYTRRYANADSDQVLDGNTYTAAPMRSSPIRQSGELARNDVKLTVARDHPIAELWRVSPPVGTMLCILKEVHDGDTEIVTAWTGHVSNVSWPSAGHAEILLSPGVVALKSTGLRELWQMGCPHVLCGSACGLDKEDFRVAATIDSISGTALSATEFDSEADGNYAGGFIEWIAANGITDYRFILSHTADDVVLASQAPGLAASDSIDIFVGCNRTFTRCQELGNELNYGGIPYFARKNPFDGQSVF